MPVPESQLVQWFIERNAEGQWALFFRVAGVTRQLSAWHESPENLFDSMRDKFAAP
jgi:hypothetical protein